VEARKARVEQAAALNFAAKAELTRRVGFAVLAEDADPEDVVKQLSDLEEIETASMPAVRQPI
jgi:ribosomal protein L7Ae-like RNA K-turn-binding protein